MPAWDDDDQPRTHILIEPSAPSELFWYLIACAKGRNAHHGPALNDDPLLAEQTRTFWNDRWSTSFNELLILAQRGGCLLTTDLDPFLDHLDSLAAQPSGELRLATESAEEADALRARLARLEREPKLRQRYEQLLRTA